MQHKNDPHRSTQNGLSGNNQIAPSDPPAPPSPALGFDIHDGKISYSAYTLNWVILAQALAEIESEIITNDRVRAAFDFWRDGVRAAVTGSLAKEWLEDRSKKNLEIDLAHYLGDRS